ncbi:hypothetical protein [Halostagnicola kamekurae]|uniref:Uncharacterized protein n=1 Tax=Halostagnicola kamekurae TaxID=619731 RepID=A0A1I6RST6_9EURY|nr:hypothetical protein [Halostagnicola kamekurae]SFS67779.1 hypothetical protein SAMN04488556_2075 [Halostagnicola kamekurae]
MQSTDQISLGTVALALLIFVVGVSRPHDTVWVVSFVSISAILLGSELFDIREWVLAGVASSVVAIIGLYWLSIGDILLGLVLIGGAILDFATWYRRLTTGTAST